MGVAVGWSVPDGVGVRETADVPVTVAVGVPEPGGAVPCEGDGDADWLISLTYWIDPRQAGSR